MNAQVLLEQLTEAYARRDLLNIDKKNAIPVEGKISELEEQAKQAVLEAGDTVKGGALQAVYSKPRVTWDSKQLDGLMIVIPELAQARKVGQPSVSIRKIGG